MLCDCRYRRFISIRDWIKNLFDLIESLRFPVILSATLVKPSNTIEGIPAAGSFTKEKIDQTNSPFSSSVYYIVMFLKIFVGLGD